VIRQSELKEKGKDFTWDDPANNCAGLVMNIETYLTAIMEILQQQAAPSCKSIHVGMLATGGMRTAQLKTWFEKRLVAELAEKVKSNTTDRIDNSEGAAVDGSLEGFFAVQTGLD